MLPPSSPRVRRRSGTADLAAVFRVIAAEYADVFWLDAGADAADGWSFLGIGVPDGTTPDAVALDVPAQPATAGADDVPWVSGWVGWRDYESGAARAGAPVADSHLASQWMRMRWALAYDHTRQHLWSITHGDDDAQVIDALCERASAAHGAATDAARTAVARHRAAEYATLIEQCRERIRAGDAYQLCLTTRFTVPGQHDAVAVYERLRTATPAHHGGFIRIAGTALLSASPELFLHAAGGRIQTRPIKGTRPRSADPVQDAALVADLVASTKERAENVMIVDLMRNDLSQVCVPGSIRVDGLWQVESYPAVHQLVSTVSGHAASGITVGDLCDAAFPAGSMTGAPKLSAMTILHELEGADRGIYSGCFGYVGDNGILDLAMVIRSIVVTTSDAIVGAGGGITWGSDAAAEVAEVATKARAPLAALGARLPEEWDTA